MNIKNKFILLGAAGMLFSCGIAPTGKETPIEDVGPDTAVYDDPLVVDMKQPAIRDGAEEEEITASGITINYHNDDGLCADREFWIWCPMVLGRQFQPNTVSADGKDMEVHFNFTGSKYKMFAMESCLYFIVKFKGTWIGQSEDVLISYQEFRPDANGMVTVWCIPGFGDAVEVFHTQEETKMNTVQYATFANWNTLNVIATDQPTSYRLYALTTSYFEIKEPKREDLKKYLLLEGTSPEVSDVTYNSAPCKEFSIPLKSAARVNAQYMVEATFADYPDRNSIRYATFDRLYETSRFRDYYYYAGDDLGATYSQNSTTFRVWAPTAGSVKVLCFDSGTPETRIAEDETAIDEHVDYPMAFRPGGIWEVTVRGDLKNKYYVYQIANSSGLNSAVDPYAKAVGIDGLRGMVVDWEETNPENWDQVPARWDGKEGYDILSPNQLTIYETHIRDLTMHETWNGTSMRGTYPAFVEKGTTYTDETSDITVKTGFDHLDELGVSAIQLEPVFDSDNYESLEDRSYNWGYNPLNYNCVDGSYSTDPYHGAVRIQEYKTLIRDFALKEEPTRIIMDVVYNHVSAAPRSNFNILMPKYYFRFTEDGKYYAGSGCANDVKTEAPMMSKFIVDSLCFWASEYKIKGFRFDLMGLIDFKTMLKAATALYKIDPDIYLYGEGWTGDGSDAHMDNSHPGSPYYGNWGSNTWTIYNKLYRQGRMCYIGAFNDAGRNALKGGNDLGEGSYGFLSQGSGNVGDKSYAVGEMMMGFHRGVGANPLQCVNYASCHDNYALFDQFTYTVGENGASANYPENAIRASMSAECAVMFSNGAAFIQGGEELFRSKEVSEEDYELYGDTDTAVINGKIISHNSYHLSDFSNAYHWDRKIKVDDVETLPYVEELGKAVRLHNDASKLMKYSANDFKYFSPYSSNSPFNVWGMGDGSTMIAVKNGDYYCFVGGYHSGEVEFSGLPNHGNLGFCTDPNGFRADGTHFSIASNFAVCLH